MSDELASALAHANEQRTQLVAELAGEDTDAYRLFHGATEGWPGLAVDRYGPLGVVQTWREPLTEVEYDALVDFYGESKPEIREWVYNHRGEGGRAITAWHQPSDRALADHTFSEMGVRYRGRARHRGKDPLLFLDLRAARREVAKRVAGKTVLNLFAYTCGVGVVAAARGARTVWNVDFASSALDVGRENLAINGLSDENSRFVHDDFFVVTRQLAGLGVKGRGRRRGRTSHTKYSERTFDVVFLDPPRWAKSRFGAVDVIRDYPSLLKPSLLATAEGGTLIATNHVASVDLDVWLDIVHRCAKKVGRIIRDVSVVKPDADFPSHDDNPPLKIVLLRV